MDVTKDTVGQSTAAGFAINTKHVKTQVLVENGGTVVIGGIFEEISSGTRPHQSPAAFLSPGDPRRTAEG